MTAQALNAPKKSAKNLITNEVYLIFVDSLCTSSTCTLKCVSILGFGYLGNKNNPPDLILKNSDAIEVKKIQSKFSNLQLNSSYPKEKLLSSNSKLSKACVTCEQWDKKDIIYAIGHVPKKSEIKTLWMVYGDCYAAEANTYEKVESAISKQINSIQDIEINETTNELSGVKHVDPLNITHLRVRGMWIIQHPQKVFNYIYSYDDSANFQLVSLMKKQKYESFPLEDRNSLEINKKINISKLQIKDPNNPAKLIDAILITFKQQRNEK